MEKTDNLDLNVSLAFKIMKDRLSKSTINHKSHQARRQDLRKKIYETFRSGDTSSTLETESAEKERTEEKQLVQNEFFIDRTSNARNANSTTTKNSEVAVETIDLSDMTQSLNDTGQPTTAQSADTNDSIKNEGKKGKKKKKRREGLSSQLNTKVSYQDIYINVDPYKDPSGHKHVKKDELVHKEPEIMKKSVITDEYEKQSSIQTVHTSHRQKKKERKLEREKTKGDKWYHMPAVELTEEQKNDLQVLQMRKALDPKRFYKANEMSTTPKFVQFGRVVESAADFYDSRIPKKQRKATIVEELLADTEFRKYNKRKYEEIQEARRMGKGPYTHMKRLKKHKK